MDLTTLTRKNSLALEHRKTIQTKLNEPELTAVSKKFPYHGFVDIRIGGCEPFVMFTNNDDFVVRRYFWNGADAYESASVRLWSKLAETAQVVIDAGSYTGLYSLVAVAKNPKAKVYAFEALDRVSTRTAVNKLVNNAHNITITNAAVGDTVGEVNFNIFRGDSVLVTGSSIHDRSTDTMTIVDVKRVRMTTLDTELEAEVGKVNLIKIDAEGAESEVITGATNIIRRDLPDILVELLSDADVKSVEKLFKGLPYNFFSIDDLTGEIKQLSHLQPASNRHNLNTLISTRTLSEINKKMMG